MPTPPPPPPPPPGSSPPPPPPPASTPGIAPYRYVLVALLVAVSIVYGWSDPARRDNPVAERLGASMSGVALWLVVSLVVWGIMRMRGCAHRGYWSVATHPAITASLTALLIVSTLGAAARQ